MNSDFGTQAKPVFNSSNLNILIHSLIGGFAFVLSANAFAANKVVVIPLGGDSVQNATSTTIENYFPANSFTTGLEKNTSLGINFPSDTGGPASIMFQRPTNWDGTSDIEVTIFAWSSVNGTVQFFVRPRDYDDGDPTLDVVGTSSEIVNWTSSEFKEITITIPANSLPKKWWHLVFHRTRENGTTLTHDGAVYLASATVATTGSAD